MGPVFCVLLLVGGLTAAGAERAVIDPFEIDGGGAARNRVDELLLESLHQKGIAPAPLCSDPVFVRRVYLDVIGTLPTAAEVRSFLGDRDPGKRARLIDDLLGRDEFPVYWSLKWCDILKVKSEFPINLWPNAVQAYQRWVLEALRENRRYDQFARELLTASGSNFRVPPVNFYRAVQGREPEELAKAVAQTFMGVRLEHWPEDRRAGMAVFFSRVAYKPTAEWKEEIVMLDPTPAGEGEGIFPDGTRVAIGPDEDPRQVFADWLIEPENPWFARCAANRVWAWLFGRGLVEEPDDMRPDNPPLHPALLDELAAELVRSDYDLRHLYRLILDSGAYQQSSVPQGDDPDAEALFACYPVRLMDAEVLIDALCQLTGTTESYSSEIPEPFTYVPEEQRSIALADGSISSPFLEMFGRPARDTGRDAERGREPTAAQRLHLLNSSHIQQKIARSARLGGVLRSAGWSPPKVTRQLYLSILSRNPTPAELEIAQAYFRTEGLPRKQAADDLVWALINSKEFLYRH